MFGVHKPYKAGMKKLPHLRGDHRDPFGPAAGPNTQLAQNIIAGYFAGARFFELKTVQKMDGADLAACINRPCILAEDECYNCEWSTELYVQQAFEEYVKAWCALKIMARSMVWAIPNGFVFNMSVGYDLAGIQGEKIDTFLNGMVDASKTPIFQECIAVLKEFFPGRKRLYRHHHPPCVRLRDGVHPPRLPAGRDRAHRQLPHGEEAPAHLRQVQPHHPGVRDRPVHSGLHGL